MLDIEKDFKRARIDSEDDKYAVWIKECRKNPRLMLWKFETKGKRATYALEFVDGCGDTMFYENADRKTDLPKLFEQWRKSLVEELGSLG